MNFKAQKITARTSQKEEEVGELPGLEGTAAEDFQTASQNPYYF